MALAWACLFSFALAGLHFAQSTLPANYQSLSAQAKRDLQWSQVLATQYSLNALPIAFPQPGSNVSELFDVNFLLQKFLLTVDEFPPDHLRSVIDPISTMCKVKFNMWNNSTSGYTGLFSSGGLGMLRLSLDGSKSANNSLYQFIINIVTKIYIDGQPSKNFQMVSNLFGQAPNHNFFAPRMANMFHGSDLDLDLSNPLEAAFEQTRLTLSTPDPLQGPESIFSLPQYEAASILSNGSPVYGPIIAPYEHIFRSPLYIDPNSQNDFRVDISNVVNVGTVIYNVFAKRANDNSTEEAIGQVIAETPCIPSQYGDDTIFFQQPRQRWRL
jgi:hypothetical protein